MIKVSVIVPVYNVFEYIDDCLNSLVNQTLKDIEIIVINDGSSDNSQSIIDSYAKKYSNIKAFKKENGGLSDTRNFGIKHARGEYITFVDGDDYVNSDMYEKMYAKAKSNDFDIVSCDINYVYPNDNKIVYTVPKKDTSNIKKVFIDLYPTVCTKLFKRELFTKTDLLFKTGVWFEDVEFMYRLLPYVNKIGVLHEAYYQYVQRDKSITRTVSDKIYDYVDNFNGLVLYYQKNKLFDKYYKEIEYAYVRYLYATFVRSCLKYDYDKYLKAVDDAKKNVLNKFPKYRRNHYFYQSFKGLYLVLFSKTLAKILYKVRSK